MKKSLLLLCFISSTSFAQLRITAAFSYLPPAGFSDTSGSFERTHYELKTSVPLYTHRNNDNNNFSRLSTHISAARSEIACIGITEQVNNAAAGLSYLFHWKTKNTFITSLRCGFSESVSTSDDPRIKTSGTLLYRRQPTSRFALLMGVAAGETYSGLRALPILGMTMRPSHDLAINIIFPLRFSVRIAPERKLGLNIQLSPKGIQWRGAPVSITESSAIYKERHLEASCLLRYSPFSNLNITAGAAWLFHRKFTINGTAVEPLPSGMITAGLSWRIRIRKPERTLSEEEDFILDQFDETDLLNY